ncbi:MAG: SdpI family protein, partial [Ignavibacterium sp.]
YPPNKINSLYGYRTKLSLKSKEAWSFAQRYSAKKSLQIGFLMLIIGISSIFLPVDTKEIQSWLSVLIVILFSGILVYLTEKKLKEKF